jgi:hypothetical protein
LLAHVIVSKWFDHLPSTGWSVSWPGSAGTCRARPCATR